MASLFLGCGALLSRKARARRKALRDAEKEYRANFDRYRWENERRVQRIQSTIYLTPVDVLQQNHHQSHQQQSTGSPPPPSYDAVRREVAADERAKLTASAHERPESVVRTKDWAVAA
ncbi:hypothetical protein IWZ01DRAFT_541505 [Phyllosticta capitalensis]